MSFMLYKKKDLSEAVDNENSPAKNLQKYVMSLNCNNYIHSYLSISLK